MKSKAKRPARSRPRKARALVKSRKTERAPGAGRKPPKPHRTSSGKKERADEGLSWLPSFPENNPMPLVEVDLATGAVDYLNPAAKRLFPDLPRLGMRHPFLAGLESLADLLERYGGGAARREVAVGGSWYEQSVYAYGGRQQLRIFGLEVTDRKRKEENLRRFNRTLMAHNQSSHAMMRATDESQYLSEVCRIIVEDCGHAMVWVGYAEDDEAKTVRPVAHAGFERGYLETLNITWADTERGRGPTGTAIRTGKPAVCKDMRNDPRFTPWREAAIERGYASSCVVPLKADGGVLGAINIYSREADSFSDDEVELLTNLADDVAFGITALRLRLAHRRSEDALRESEERYRALVDSAPDPVIAHRDGRFIYANSAALRLYGANSFEQLAAHGILDLVPSADRDQARVRVEHVVRGDSLPRREARIVRLDGEEVPVESAAGAVEYGGERAVLVFLRDITERKRAVEALHKSEATLRGILNATKESIWLFAPNGVVLMANEIAVSRLGKTMEEVLGRNFNEVLPPELARTRMVRLREVVESGQPVEFEDQRAGLYFLHNFYPISDTDGGVVAVVSFSRDISRRKQIEEQLRETRDYLENLFGYANAPIIVWDPELKITRFNRAFERLTGRRADDVIGKHLDLLFPEESREESLEHIRRAVAGERWEVVEIPIERVDGGVRTVLWNSATIFGVDGVTAIATMAQGQDISLRKQAQEALADALGQARRRAEEVSALLAASRAALEQRSFGVAARAIFESCKGLLGATGGYVALCTEDELRFNPAYIDPGGPSAPVVFEPSMSLRGLWAEACRGRRAVVANSLTASQLPAGYRGLKNLLLEPLVIHDEVMGFLSLSNKPDGFGDNDIRLATAFAEMTAVALFNSRTLELLEKNQEVLERLVAERTQQLEALNASLRDEIAERQQAETGLRISEKRFRDLFENVFDGVYETDAFRRIESVNGALVRMLGYASKEELIRAANSEEIFTDRDEIEQLWRKLGSQGSLRGEEIILRRKDGAVLDGLINVNAVRDERGEAIAFQGTIADITALKRAEEILRAERERLFGVLDQLPVFVYLRAEDHSVVFANRYFREQFGDPENRPCYETLGRRETPCEGCDFARVFRGGETVDWEWAAPNSREYQVHHYPFVDSDGTRLVLALGVDVTEQKVAYEAEKIARQTADTLREVSLALTKSLDVDTVLLSLLDHLKRIVPFDRAKVMLLETEGHLAVRAVLDSGGALQLPEEPRPSFPLDEAPIVNRILTTRDAVLIADIHEHPEFGPRVDPAFEHSWLGIPLVARGTVIGMYSLGKRDAGSLTLEHQHLAEAVAAQSAVAVQNAMLFEQVQSASARLQGLSRRLVEVQETERRAIARELHDEASQSLTSILFGLRLLEKGLPEDQPALAQISELKRTTDGVMEALHRLATDLRPASLEHLGFVAAVRQHLARIESTSGIKVGFMARDLEGARLPNAVETTLFRIVQEALTNVLRHARAGRVDVLAERRGDRAIVVVEDDGVGFEANDAPGEGRLGHVGMRERAEALGGTLTVESSPGAGTTVVVEVPCADSGPDRR